MNDEIIQYLTRLKFIGPFPLDIIALLVPVESALAEARTIDSSLTRPLLLKLFREEGIEVFGSVEDWVNLKTKIKEDRAKDRKALKMPLIKAAEAPYSDAKSNQVA